MSTIRVLDKESAWAIAAQLFPTDFELDKERSERSGCQVYVSAAEGFDGFCIIEKPDNLAIWLGATGPVVEVRIEGETIEALVNKNRQLASQIEAFQHERRLCEDYSKRYEKIRDAYHTANQRAEAAEAEIFRLKAKLYDCIVEGKC